MGRITNVIGLRNINNVQNFFYGNNFYKKNNLYYSNLRFLIQNIFLNNYIKFFGFILGFSSIYDNNNLIFKLFLYDVEDFDLDLVVINNKKNNFWQQNYNVKLLFIEKIILESLSFFLKKKKLKIEFYILSSEIITAQLIINYVLIKLKQQFQLGDILYPLVRFLKEQEDILGYRIDCIGRFTRKQRASFLTLKSGNTPFSSLNKYIEYEEYSIILKYGKCSIKVWLYKSDNFIPYFFCVKEKK